MRFLPVLMLLVAGLGCGTKPVTTDDGSRVPEGPTLFVDAKTVIGRALPADVMLLVSRSSSMLTNTSTAPPCPSTIGGCGLGSPCPAGCPTRLSEMQAVLGSFIDANARTSRFAVSVFPSNDLCGATREVLLDFPPEDSADELASLLQQAASAKAALANITPGGMAPIAGSLEFIHTLPAFNHSRRTKLVVLVTDGAPNCNGGNPNTCANAAACRCTQSECTTANGLCELGCTDDQNAVAAVEALRADEVDTVVVAIGSDATTPDTTLTLNQLAQAGNLALSCPTNADAECGSAGPCDTTTQLCSREFLFPSGGDDLNLFLQPVGGEPEDVCTFFLNQNPEDLAHLTVRVDGRAEAPCAARANCNTWVLEHDGTIGQVVFLGATCDAIRESTVLTPVSLRFEIVK